VTAFAAGSRVDPRRDYSVAAMVEIRVADLTRDEDALRRLWLEYFTWVNGELEVQYGFPTSTTEEFDHEMATIAKYERPDGRLLMAFLDGVAIGTVAMRRIGPDTAELKRMYVQPTYRRGGVGRALVGELIAQLQREGYGHVRLESPDFLAAAHTLYRSVGFEEIGPYPESEIPDEWLPQWLFMERRLGRETQARER
jgi:GNAT superfamily N-acetyltransferase